MSLSRFIAVLFVFVLVGPPVGAVTVSLAGSLVALVLGDDSGMAGLVFYSGLLGIPLSWLVGGVQAAFAGLAFAASAAVGIRSSVAFGIAGGFIAGLAYLFRAELDWPTAGVILVAHVVAAAVCGMIATAMLRVRPRDAA